MSNQTYIFWNLKSLPRNINSNSVIIFWNNSTIIEDDFQISISKFIEENHSLVKSEYLKWINDLSQMSNLNSCFSTDSNYSLWLSSILLSKQVMSRSYNSEILKLIAFNLYVKKNNIRRIRIESHNYNLNLILYKYCLENQIEICNSENLKFQEKSTLSFFKSLLYAFSWILRFYVKTFNIKRLSGVFFSNHSAKITIFTYFDNSSISSSNENKYWIGLNKYLKTNNISSNWIHLSSINDNSVKSKGVNEKFKNDYNNSNKNEKHLLLNEFMSIQIFFKSLEIWIKLVLQFIKHKKNIFIPKIGGFNVELLLKNDIQNSLIGQYSISNITYLNLIKKVLKTLPKQELCLYPYENQSWEYSLLFNWKKLFGSKIIGNAHSSVRYWDLRYFNDQDYFVKNFNYSFPDLIAVNSSIAKKHLIISGTPANKIIEVEALRYNYILDLDTLAKYKNNKEILILGDYSISITEELLEMVYHTFKDVDDIKFSLKFHPLCILDLSKYEQMNFKIINNPISEIINNYDVCLSSETTTAAIEFWEKDKKVITYVNGINFSPLRGCQNVSFVYNKTELYKSVLSNLKPSKSTSFNNYFILNKEIPIWRGIIKNNLQ
jgi:surface carbohydrate biosynthesis protein (TIGR04326 family)